MNRIAIVTIDEKGATTRTLEVSAGTLLGEALEIASIALPEGWGVSLWGEKRDLRTLLSDGDRIEVAALILIDPKERRRRRAELQGDVRQVTCGRHGGKHRLA